MSRAHRQTQERAIRYKDRCSGRNDVEDVTCPLDLDQISRKKKKNGQASFERFTRMSADARPDMIGDGPEPHGTKSACAPSRLVVGVDEKTEDEVSREKDPIFNSEGAGFIGDFSIGPSSESGIVTVASSDDGHVAVVPEHFVAEGTESCKEAAEERLNEPCDERAGPSSTDVATTMIRSRMRASGRFACAAEELDGLMSSMESCLVNPYERFIEEDAVQPGVADDFVRTLRSFAARCSRKRAVPAICGVISITIVVSLSIGAIFPRDVRVQNGTLPEPGPSPIRSTTPRPDPHSTTPRPLLTTTRAPRRPSPAPIPSTRRWSLNLRNFSCAGDVDIEIICRSEAREICVRMKLRRGTRPDEIWAIRTDTLDVKECYGFENFEEV